MSHTTIFFLSKAIILLFPAFILTSFLQIQPTFLCKIFLHVILFPSIAYFVTSVYFALPFFPIHNSSLPNYFCYCEHTKHTTNTCFLSNCCPIFSHMLVYLPLSSRKFFFRVNATLINCLLIKEEKNKQ